MNRLHKDRTCTRLGLILLAGLIALTSATVARAQSNDNMVHALNPFIHSFNQLAGNFGEMGFNYRGLQDERISSWRTTICRDLVEAVEDENMVNAFRSISSESARIIADSAVLDQLPPLAKNGDEFTRFLDEEEKYLTQLELSQQSRELALQQAVRFRAHIANSTAQYIGANMSQFSLQQLRDRVTLLCDDQYSPAHNESTAGWKAWLWHGLELLGGFAVFSANLLANPEPTTKAMSMAIGTIVAGNGYSGLSSLFLR